MTKVALVKGDRSLQTVEKALRLVDGLERLTDKPILIKVNFITTKTWDTGATTDPILVEALIKSLKPINNEIAVIESDATATSADRAYELTGMKTVCEKHHVPFINLGKVKERVKVRVPNPLALSKITLPKMVLESHVISAAKLKTHDETQVTLGLKNMFGLIPDRMKFMYHTRGIERVIIDINSVVKPSLTVIDGFIGMEGNGPVNGTPVRMDLIIAGKDSVATDSVACMVMGFDPKSIYHIRRASEKGIGSIENFEVVGERIENVRRVFVRA